MAFSLAIRFEGLSLFVQRQKTEPGLHVLFPKHPGHILEVKVLSSGAKITALGVEDLHRPGNPNAVPVPIRGAISMKTATGRGTVRKELLEGVLHSQLAARFRLPFPDLYPDLFTENVGAKAVREDGSEVSLGSVSGIVIMMFTFSAPIKIGNVTVATDDALAVTNAPPGAASGPHRVGELMPHAPAYIPLVTGGTHKIKEFRTTTPYTPTAIDPVDCTVGTGCPYDEPDCGNG
jgi:hypothetical protein